MTDETTSLHTLPAMPLAMVDQLYDSPVELLPLLNNIPMPVVLLSKEKRVLLLNRPAQALTGFTQEEAQGLPCRHVLRSSLCVRGCPLDAMQAEDRAVVHEADIINKLRQRIPVRGTLSPAVTARGRLAGYIECIEDLRPLSEMATRQQAGFTFGRIVGRSPQMERLFQLVPAIASSDSSVLVTGETGTGKDLLAEAIHQASPRSKGPFVKVNCGALPETLLESELFGHRKGAFTGATENKPGRFQLAHNGTLFLTEIGDLPITLQVKLLTFLDDRVISPLGGSMPVPVNVRLIAATHRNLEEMVRAGTFRQDLFFRLNVVRLHIPALRDREEDVALLLDHFLRRINEEFKKHVQTLSDDARDILLHYTYPGNVRELRNIVEYAVNVCAGSRIEVTHLPAYLMEQSDIIPIAFKRLETISLATALPVPAGNAAVQEGDSWSDTEKRMILQALAQAKGRRGKAAELLGWGRSTLWRKMKQYGLDS